MSSFPENVSTLHREVQRKFGRNLLRLQQYERLMKTLVAEQDIAGPVGDLHIVKTQLIESVSKKTLGQVVGDLTGNYLTSTLGKPSSEQNEEPPCDLTQPWGRMSFRIELTEDDYKRTQQKLANFVDLRNELVHHFLDNYDIWTESGCLAADVYLEECFKEIDAHYEELQNWAKHTVDARIHTATLMNTPEFEDFFIHGILPGKAGVYWAASTIVNLLRDAEAALAKEGWTSLQNAITFIGKLEPEHNPKRYGCSSWRNLLHDSEQFEVRKEQSAPGLPTVIWYRSRP